MCNIYSIVKKSEVKKAKKRTNISIDEEILKATREEPQHLKGLPENDLA